jgi:hypothetical protein
MFWLWWFLAFVLAAFGLPCVLVGLILLLCEYSWEDGPRGRTGGQAFLLAGALLCLPAALLCLLVLLDKTGVF